MIATISHQDSKRIFTLLKGSYCTPTQTKMYYTYYKYEPKNLMDREREKKISTESSFYSGSLDSFSFSEKDHRVKKKIRFHGPCVCAK